jgi:hypothetical protein
VCAVTNRPCRGIVDNAVAEFLLETEDSILVLVARRSEEAVTVVVGDLTTRTAVDRVVRDENMLRL